MPLTRARGRLRLRPTLIHYPSEKKKRTAFDVKGLTELGLVPINIIIDNEGPDALSVNGPTISLLDPRNRSFEAVPAKEVVKMILRRRSDGPTTLGRFPRFPLPRGRIGKDAFEIEADFIRKSLQHRVRPQSMSWGFVFFQLPEKEALWIGDKTQGGHKTLIGYKIYIPEVENTRTGEKLLYFEVELQ